MSRFEGYSDEELSAALQNPKATKRIKMDIQKELNKRQPKAALDPVSGAPTGGAPEALVNFMPSMFSLGDDISTGIANTLTDPIGTMANVIPGMVQHYGDRYFTPEQGQPWYSDAVNTFNQDPAGAMMDLSGVGTAMKMAGGAGRVGKVGAGLERLDPVTALMGGAQTIAAPIQSRMTGMPSPAESMAGSDYGQPRGSQRENLPGYLNTIESAMDQQIPPTVRGVETAKAATQKAGAEIGAVLDQMEASGTTFDANNIVGRLEDIKLQYELNADAPLRKAVDEMIEDIINQSDANGRIQPRAAQTIKERYAAKVNYDGATPAVERTTQEGYAQGSGVLREDLRSNPDLAPAYDNYQAALGVQDVVQRGAAADVTRSGKGLSGDFIAQLLNTAAPLLTGQNKLDRNRVRMSADRGRPFEAYSRATERTPFGVIRQGAYIADQSGKTSEDNRWHVGRLWEE